MNWVVLLTFVMMVVEIAVGYATRSMALLADGWHMATHVGALGLVSLSYVLARRFANHRAFSFGTGKIQALSGYTSALLLGLVALAMIVESVTRLLTPQVIDFSRSLPVAAVGLIVNWASLLLLHGHDENPEEVHDHNHRAAYLHVLADAFTSILAIVALLLGKFLGLSKLDAVIGILGGAVIVRWAFDLLRSGARELLDASVSPVLEDAIRDKLEALGDVWVRDLHVWSIGGDATSCIVSLATTRVDGLSLFRETLAPFGLAHLTIEVNEDCVDHRPSVET